MAVTDWIDKIAALWSSIDDGQRSLRSYRVFERAEWPESITNYPCALTYTVDVSSEYSAGGMCEDHWRGVTEFHLVPSIARHHYPYIMAYFARIRDAAASSITLSGSVASFALRTKATGGPSISGPIKLR